MARMIFNLYEKSEETRESLKYILKNAGKRKLINNAASYYKGIKISISFIHAYTYMTKYAHKYFGEVNNNGM